MNEITHAEVICLPLTQSALQTAQRFARDNFSPEKAEQIYLNTLAVWTVHSYCQLMDIATSLEASDSWNPAIRLTVDIADLMVTGLGRLVCRPVLKGSSSCHLPLEERGERLGYIMVEIDSESKKGIILGFAPSAETGELFRADLQPLDTFLEQIDELERSQVNLTAWLTGKFSAAWQDLEAVFVPQPETTVEPNAEDTTNLTSWFGNIFQQGWQGIGDLFTPPPEANWQFRSYPNLQQRNFLERLGNSDIARAKLIDLGFQLREQNLALLVAITQEEDQRLNILVQLHSVRESILPANLDLILLSEAMEILQEVTSRSQDQYIQLRRFRVEPNTKFQLKVTSDELSFIESFTT